VHIIKKKKETEERQRMTILDMGAVCEQRFEGLVYYQGASIR
jgi:hypothetical protein